MEGYEDMYGGRSRQMSPDWRCGKPFMNADGVDIENYHMGDAYNDRQNERDWIKRSNRDRESKVDRYRDDRRSMEDDLDDDRRDRHGGRHQRHDKRTSRDSRHRETSRTRDSSKEGRDMRSRDHMESRDSRRDSRGHDRERRDSRWNDHDDDSLDSSEPQSENSRTSRNVSGEHEGENYKYETPNNTIMIRGLAQHITENDIRQDILNCSLMPKDIRLIRKKDTGASRGFAFVEFSTVQEASQWMEMKQGVLMLQDQYRAIMHFSIPKETQIERNALKSSQDWICIKCAAHNFKRRDACFKCHASRQESEGGEGSAEVSMQPTSTVLLRGLDVLSTEDSVLQAIKSVSSVPIRSIRIGLDPLTNTSRGVCYLEMNHVMDAVYMHNALVASSPVVDGKKVLVSYRKTLQNLHSSSSNTSRPDAEALTRRSSSGDLTRYTLEDVPRLADYSASLYATSSTEYTAYQQYYTQYYRNQISQGSLVNLPSQSQADSVNAAAAVAQCAIQQVQAAKEIKKQIEVPQLLKTEEKATFEAPNTTVSPTTIAQPSSNAKKCTVPDVSTYQYDETSGYYYDPQTGLYYDASSQYYYNPQSRQFLYWDAEKQAYLPAPIATEDSSSGKDDGKKGKEKDRQDKVKVAKKIAKDMERWAKTLNQKKDNARQNLSMASSVLPTSKPIGAADAGYAVLERKERPPIDFNVMPFDDPGERQPEPPSPQDGAGLVAAYGGGSESDEDIEDVIQEDRQHTNWGKLACLLCKRQFPTKDSLMRHQQLSDLHKLNLETWYRVRGLDPDDPQQRNKKYRDRAKERRQKFTEPEAPHPNHLKEKYLKTREDAASISYEEPTKAGIGSDNVGNKLLQKMGWQEGMGLGKSNQGRTSIIQTERRSMTAGLGAKGGTYGALPGETYKDCVKKMMFARYQELTEQEH